MDSQWFAVRLGHVTVGRIAFTRLGWVAYDDRHGEARVSLHETEGQAESAVLLRSAKTTKQLDSDAAEIVDRIRELRRLRSELDQPIDPHRVAEVLERANEIGRSWDA